MTKGVDKSGGLRVRGVSCGSHGSQASFLASKYPCLCGEPPCKSYPPVNPGSPLLRYFGVVRCSPNQTLPGKVSKPLQPRGVSVLNIHGSSYLHFISSLKLYRNFFSFWLSLVKFETLKKTALFSKARGQLPYEDSDQQYVRMAEQLRNKFNTREAKLNWK